MLDQGARDSRVLVWLAAARGHAKTDARSELAAEADKLQGKDWPFPLVEFLLERRSIDQAMTAAGTPEQRCDAAFHIGQWRIARDERDSAVAYMKAAARDCEKGGVEALVAGAELKRLGQ